MSTVRCLLSVVLCLLSAVCFLLPVVCYLQSCCALCCLLSAVCCLLSAVCFLLSAYAVTFYANCRGLLCIILILRASVLGAGQAEEDVMDASRKSELQRKLTAGEDLDIGKLLNQ
jgi:hypothetical protein